MIFLAVVLMKNSNDFVGTFEELKELLKMNRRK